MTANSRPITTAADALQADDHVTAFLVTVPHVKRKSSCARVKIETTMRSDAGSTAPTGSERVKLISAIPACETCLMTDTCAGGGICPRGSDQTAQKDTTVATTQFVKALDDSAHGNVDELHFQSRKFQVQSNEADVGYSISSAGKTSQQSDWFEFNGGYQVMLPGAGGQTPGHVRRLECGKAEENRGVYQLPGSATESTNGAPLCKFRVVRLVVEATTDSETEFDVNATFGSRAISVQVNIVAVSDHVFHRLPFDLLIQVCATQLSLLSCISFVFMATDRACEDAMHTSLPGSPPLSSNVGSPNGSGHDLDLMGHRSIDAQFKELRDILLPLARGFADFDNHVKTLSEAVGMVTSRIASVEQTVNALSAKIAMFAEMDRNFNHLTARMCKVETYAASTSNVSRSARSWPSVEQDNGSTAAGSHGPGSSDDNRNTRRRLDPSSSTEDEQSRSAVLFLFPCGQYREGITKWIDTLWEESNMLACNKPCRIHCKAGSV